MNRREKQFYNNLNVILGEYENGRMDFPEDYPSLTEEEWIIYVMQDIYHLKAYGNGFTQYGDDICKDLRFLGNDFMYEAILKAVHEEGLVVE